MVVKLSEKFILPYFAEENIAKMGTRPLGYALGRINSYRYVLHEYTPGVVVFLAGYGAAWVSIPEYGEESRTQLKITNVLLVY